MVLVDLLRKLIFKIIRDLQKERYLPAAQPLRIIFIAYYIIKN